MTENVTQPTANPTRKMWAVIISGAIVGGGQAALGQIYPEADFTAVLAEFGPIITAAIVVAAGYVTKERA